MSALRLFLFASLLVAPLAASAAPRSTDDAVLRRKVVTRDGVALALYRFVPVGGGMQKPAVLLVPDLTLGREAFDLAGGGLARWLQARGRDVFVAELRGHGRSGTPKSWRLEEIVTKDLPAIVAAIQAAHPGEIDLVAHGYSGTLALVASTEELKGRIRRVVALSTPVEPGPAAPAMEVLLEEGGGFERLAMNAAGAKLFELLYAKRGNFPPRRLAELRGTGLNDLGARASKDLLGWLRDGDLRIGQGSVRSRLERYDRPTLLVLPLGDRFANPEFASPLRDVAIAAPIQVRLLSRLQLMKEDYSHLSILHGEDAALDVFAPALAFLEADTQQAPVHVEATP